MNLFVEKVHIALKRHCVIYNHISPFFSDKFVTVTQKLTLLTCRHVEDKHKKQKKQFYIKLSILIILMNENDSFFPKNSICKIKT